MGSTTITILSIIAILISLAGMAALILWRKRMASPSSPARQVGSTSAVRSAEDELNALGILEIRPKGATPSVKDDEPVAVVSRAEEESGERSDGAEESFRAMDRKEVEEAADSDAMNEEAAPKTSSNRGGVSRREALFRLMNAVQASVDGYTACLVKRGIDGRCAVEAFVSQNPQALESESFLLNAFFSGERVLEQAVTVFEVGTADLPTDTLLYYNDPVAVRQLAIAPIKGADGIETYFLLVDALSWQDLDDPWQRLMIGQFATLLGTFLATPVSDDDGEFVRPRIRPRREIIAEEMSQARSESYPLALALVYLNSAEDVSKTGEKAVVDAERIMGDRLGVAANGSRLERFGELTYGVFFAEEVSEVEAWALRLQQELLEEGHYFENGVSIGIALLQDRHEDADDFRADATDALREAYETGACTIIE